MNNIKELRESLSSEQIKDILSKYGVYPFSENENVIIFPTCCHNLVDGSPKLNYYKNTQLFVCYTECGCSFDIFELLMKMESLRGNEITIQDAIKIAGLENDYEDQSQDKKDAIRSLEYIKRIQNTTVPHAAPLTALNHNVLNKYIFNEKLLMPWIDEGMSVPTLKRFEIMYDPSNLAIVIPHKNKDGEIVGVRGRFMDPEAPNKYMPLTYQGKFMRHNIRDNLYGIYENEKAIKKSKTVFIFEGEKSVLLYDSYFGASQNYALATCGNKISKEQISLLRELGVKEVVLCYDKDYETYEDMLKVQEHYTRIGQNLSNYFKTSIVMDYGNSLGYKDSPIDQGPEVFKELYKYRYYI